MSSITGEILCNKKDKGIEMNLFTDNKSLFYIINMTNVILDKRLRVDIAALRLRSDLLNPNFGSQKSALL